MELFVDEPPLDLRHLAARIELDQYARLSAATDVARWHPPKASIRTGTGGSSGSSVPRNRRLRPSRREHALQRRSTRTLPLPLPNLPAPTQLALHRRPSLEHRITAIHTASTATTSAATPASPLQQQQTQPLQRALSLPQPQHQPQPQSPPALPYRFASSATSFGSPFAGVKSPESRPSTSPMEQMSNSAGLPPLARSPLTRSSTDTSPHTRPPPLQQMWSPTPPFSPSPHHGHAHAQASAQALESGKQSHAQVLERFASGGSLFSRMASTHTHASSPARESTTSPFSRSASTGSPYSAATPSPLPSNIDAARPWWQNTAPSRTSYSHAAHDPYAEDITMEYVTEDVIMQTEPVSAPPPAPVPMQTHVPMAPPALQRTHSLPRRAAEHACTWASYAVQQQPAPMHNYQQPFSAPAPAPVPAHVPALQRTRTFLPLRTEQPRLERANTYSGGGGRPRSRDTFAWPPNKMLPLRKRLSYTPITQEDGLSDWERLVSGGNPAPLPPPTPSPKKRRMRALGSPSDVRGAVLHF